MPAPPLPPRPTVHLALVPPPPGGEHADRVANARAAAEAAEVAAEVADVLAGTAPEVLASAPLALPLALSVPMARHGLSADELAEAMLVLRAAILAEAGLDPVVEPTPLATGDGRRTSLVLAGYLHDLLCRAACRTGTAPGALAASAAARLLTAEAPARRPGH